jgi:hypothetical protein
LLGFAEIVEEFDQGRLCVQLSIFFGPGLLFPQLELSLLVFKRLPLPKGFFMFGLPTKLVALLSARNDKRLLAIGTRIGLAGILERRLQPRFAIGALVADGVSAAEQGAFEFNAGHECGAVRLGLGRF